MYSFLFLLLPSVICLVESRKLVDFFNVNLKPGQAGVGKLTNVQFCDTESDDPIVVSNMYLNNVGDGFKSFSGDIHFPRVLSPNITFKMDIYQYMLGNWVFIFGHEDDVCNAIKWLARKAWQSIREQLDPPILEECAGGPGDWSARDIQVSRNDVTKPPAVSLKYKVIFRIYDETQTSFGCLMVFGEVNPR